MRFRGLVEKERNILTYSFVTIDRQKTYVITKIFIIPLFRKEKNHLKFISISEPDPIVGGNLLKSVALILDFVEFMGDIFFWLYKSH